MDSYVKVCEFLNSRGINYLANGFITNKIDDHIAANVDDTKLQELGLMYGDIIMFRQTFPLATTNSRLTTYKERANELRNKIQRTHTGRKDALDRPVCINASYQVNFGLKCFEGGKYRLKMKNSFSKTMSRTATYIDILMTALQYYKIHESSNSYLGTYEGKKLENKFQNLEEFAISNKKKKSQIRFYVHYPDTFQKLEWKKLLSDIGTVNESGSEQAEENNSQETTAGTAETTTSIINISPTDITSSGRKICNKCHCTYLSDECLVCEQNEQFEAATASNQLHDCDHPNLASEMNFDASATSYHQQQDAPPPVVHVEDSDDHDEESDGSPLLDSVRSARVRRFAGKPIRFRQSIGEPIGDPAHSSTLSIEKPVTNEGFFGDEEVKRFLETAVDEVEAVELPLQQNEINIEDIIQDALKQYEDLCCNRKKKTIVVQRATEKFWEVLVNHNFDLTRHYFSVRFGGEAAADVGGPLREFLTCAMKRLPQISGAFSGGKQVYFAANAELILNNTYYKIGQLVALSILSLGRGPEAFHPVLVRALFNIPQPEVLEDIEDALITYSLNRIENEQYDVLLDLDINPFGKTKQCIKKLYMLSTIVFSKYAAINQFREGVSSVSPTLVQQNLYSTMRNLFEENFSELSFDDIVSILYYPQLDTAENGSNDHAKYSDAVTEFEVFLSLLESKEEKIDDKFLTLEDFLRFSTGAERIPPHGFEKKIYVYFEGVSLPKASTCGLTVTSPFVGIANAFKMAWKYGGGFGVI